MDNGSVIDGMFHQVDSFLSSSYILSNAFQSDENIDGPYTFWWSAFVILSRILLMLCFLCVIRGVIMLI